MFGIRSAGIADADAIAGIHLETMEELARIVPDGFGEWIKLPVSAESVTADMRKELGDVRVVSVVAEVGGKIAGFALGWVEEHSDDLISAPFLTIVYLETARELRKRGVARALLAEMELLARARGIRTIDLQVWLTNKPAMRLYVEAGYKPLEMRMSLTRRRGLGGAD